MSKNMYKYENQLFESLLLSLIYDSWSLLESLYLILHFRYVYLKKNTFVPFFKKGAKIAHKKYIY